MLSAIIVRFCLLLVVIFTGLLIVSVLRAVFLEAPRRDPHPCTPDESNFIPADEGVVSRFQAALRFRSVTKEEHVYNREQLLALHNHIISSFPIVHSSPLVTWHQVANYSLLYIVQGSNKPLKPYLLAAHLDVVPADDESLWEVPPFSGNIHNGFIYGRGAIDVKHSVFGILEALEFKLKKNWIPTRTFYVAFGHDEEAGGLDGAAAISRLLHDQGLTFEFLLDEGTPIVQNVIPGLKQPVALISTSEKGFVNVKLSVTMPAGHSSMPGRFSSIGILAKAISRLEDHLHENMFGMGPEVALLERVAPHMNFMGRLVLSNLWLFSPLVSRIMSMNPSTNAMIRTTTAVTMINGGIKDNIISPYAEAIINHRIHPLQTVEQVLKRDREIINDERVKIEAPRYLEPHPVSDHGSHSFGFQTISRSVSQVWGFTDVIISPGLMIANTDTVHYLNLTRSIYRFSPTFSYPEDFKRFHGDNERIGVQDYERTINYYQHLLSNADLESLPKPHHEQHSADL